jgi:hypothetical protein
LYITLETCEVFTSRGLLSFGNHVASLGSLALSLSIPLTFKVTSIGVSFGMFTTSHGEHDATAKSLQVIVFFLIDRDHCQATVGSIHEVKNRKKRKVVKIKTRPPSSRPQPRELHKLTARDQPRAFFRATCQTVTPQSHALATHWLAVDQNRP